MYALTMAYKAILFVVIKFGLFTFRILYDL